MASILKRCFWTISKGQIVGYIEQAGTEGVIFSNKYMSFRPTTSNASSHGNILDISISKYAEDKLPMIQEAMQKRLPVTIEYEQDLIGSPRVGSILEQVHLKSIKMTLPEDAIHDIREAIREYRSEYRT